MTLYTDFGKLPPHFKSYVDVCIAIPEAILAKATISLQKAFPFLIASVVYHWDWLHKNLPRSHPYFSSKIFTSGIYETWKPLIVTGLFKNQETGMRASGLPKIIVNLLETRMLQDSILGIPNRTADIVCERISSALNVQIHNSDILNRILDPRFTLLESTMQSLVEVASRFTAQNLTNSGLNDQSARNGSRLFFWGGLAHYHPENFIIPSESSVKLWNLWLFGDANEVNIPYRNLVGNYMSNAGRVRLSRVKMVMESIRKEINLPYDAIASLGPREAEKLFNIAYGKLFGHLKSNSNMQCSNAYKHDLKARKPKNTQRNQ